MNWIKESISSLTNASEHLIDFFDSELAELRLVFADNTDFDIVGLKVTWNHLFIYTAKAELKKSVNQLLTYYGLHISWSPSLDHSIPSHWNISTNRTFYKVEIARLMVASKSRFLAASGFFLNAFSKWWIVSYSFTPAATAFTVSKDKLNKLKLLEANHNNIFSSSCLKYLCLHGIHSNNQKDRSCRAKVQARHQIRRE